MSRKQTFNRFRRQVNTEFLISHGLPITLEDGTGQSKDRSRVVTGNVANVTLDGALEKARETGKLSLAGSVPLIRSHHDLDRCFDLRAGIRRNECSFEDNANNRKFWECYGEEGLTMVDFSDNDLTLCHQFDKGGCKMPSPDEVERGVTLDKRIERYRSLKVRHDYHYYFRPWLNYSVTQHICVDFASTSMQNIRYYKGYLKVFKPFGKVGSGFK